eukprot:167725_1
MVKSRSKKRKRTKSSSKQNSKRKRRKIQSWKRCQGTTSKSTRCKRKVKQTHSYCYQHLYQDNVSTPSPPTTASFENLVPLTLNQHALCDRDLDRIIQFREEYDAELELYMWEKGFMQRSEFVFSNNMIKDENGVAYGHKRLLNAIQEDNWIALGFVYKPIYPKLTNQHFARQYYRHIIEIDYSVDPQDGDLWAIDN